MYSHRRRYLTLREAPHSFVSVAFKGNVSVHSHWITENFTPGNKHSPYCRLILQWYLHYSTQKHQIILVNYTTLIGLNCVQYFCIFPLRFFRRLGWQKTLHYPESSAIVWDYTMCFAWQTLWLVFKRCDWMLEWQCAKFTPSVKQQFEMEWNPSTAHYSKQESNVSYPRPPPLGHRLLQQCNTIKQIHRQNSASKYKKKKSEIVQ